MASALIAALPAIGSALGGIFGNNRQGNNLQDIFTNYLNRANTGVQQGQDIFNMWSNPLYPALLDAQGQTQRNVLDQAGPQFDWSEFLAKGGPDLMRQWSQRSGEVDPALAQLFSMGGDSGPFANIGNAANQVFQGGGWTPQYQQLFDTFGGMMGGQTGTQQNVADVGNNLLSMRGQTAQSQGLQDRMMDTVNQGGWNPRLAFGADRVADVLGQGGATAGTDALTQAGLSLLQNGGLGPEGQSGLQQALGGITAGGKTGQTQGLVNRGMDLASVNALLPLELQQTMAREDARRAISGRAEEVRREAAKRGGAGSVAGSGKFNDVLADFADASGEAQSAAVREATRTYQDLAQRQQQLGGSMAGQGLGIEAGRLNTFGDLMTQILGTMNQGRSIGSSAAQGGEGLAAQRMLGALSTLPSYQNSATNAVGTLGNLGLGAAGQDISRMQLGGNLTNNVMQSMLGAGGLFNNAAGNQNQYALGAGQLGNNAFNNQVGATNTGLGGLLSSIGLGQQQGQNTGQFVNNANQGWQNMYNMNSQNWGRAMAPMVDFAGQGSNTANNWISSIGNAYGGSAQAAQRQPNTWTQMGGLLGGGLGGLLGGSGRNGGQRAPNGAWDS